MARFHIGRDGNPRECTAEPGKCPLGGEHYDSMEKATEAAERQVASHSAASSGSTRLTKTWQHDEGRTQTLKATALRGDCDIDLEIPQGSYVLRKIDSDSEDAASSNITAKMIENVNAMQKATSHDDSEMGMDSQVLEDRWRDMRDSEKKEWLLDYGYEENEDGEFVDEYGDEIDLGDPPDEFLDQNIYLRHDLSMKQVATDDGPVVAFDDVITDDDSGLPVPGQSSHYVLYSKNYVDKHNKNNPGDKISGTEFTVDKKRTISYGNLSNPTYMKKHFSKKTRAGAPKTLKYGLHDWTAAGGTALSDAKADVAMNTGHKAGSIKAVYADREADIPDTVVEFKNGKAAYYDGDYNETMYDSLEEALKSRPL